MRRLCLALLIASAACTATSSVATPDPTTTVTYAVVEGVPLALDVFLPGSPGPHAAVVLVHGDDWQTGDKTEIAGLAAQLHEWGYTAFSINYRLAPAYPFPAPVADIQCAVAWVREHADDYGVDSRRIALLGSAAGGHLALLAALANSPSAPVAAWQPSCGNGVGSAAVQAVVSISAPLDLLFHAQESANALNDVTLFLGLPCQVAGDACAAASPLTYAAPDAPPALLIHGTADAAASSENSERMAAALEAAGAEVTYLPIRGAVYNFMLELDTPEAQQALDALERFLREILLSQ